MKLEDIAVIKSAGQIKSEEIEQEGLEKFYLVNGSHVTDFGFLDEHSKFQALYAPLKDIESKKLVAGDIILLAKGTQLRAALITENDVCEKNLIPSNIFLVIQMDKNYLQPEILVGYLNSHIGQANLNQLIQGTVLKNIPIKSLKTLEIVLDENLDQELLAQLFHHNISVLKNMECLITQHKSVFNAAIEKFIK